MKNMIKDAAILFAITLISGLLLGFVYDLTKEPIAAKEISRKQEAYKQVFPDADSFDEDAVTVSCEEATEYVKQRGFDADIAELVIAKDSSGKQIGYVITVTDHEGYGGDISFAVGIDNDGISNGVSILSISETAGLGMRAEEVLVPQMGGKDLKSKIGFVKNGGATGNEIDAISGATVTTKAFVNGINAASLVYNELLSEGKEAGQ